jgi:hypothetical protein
MFVSSLQAAMVGVTNSDNIIDGQLNPNDRGQSVDRMMNRKPVTKEKLTRAVVRSPPPRSGSAA